MAFLVPDDLRSRKTVPQAVRRLAEAFMIGLDETATVWYEPPYDPSGQKPDFVLLVPDRGIVVLEAMAVRDAEMLGVFRSLIRLAEDGREIEVANPLARAELLCSSLGQAIRSESRLKGRKLRVKPAVALPNLRKREAMAKGLDRIVPLEVCLFKDEIDAALDGSGEAGLLRFLARLLGKGNGRETNEREEKLLRAIIHPDIRLEQITETTSAVQLSIFSNGGRDYGSLRLMDRTQEAMAKSFGDGHRIIRGAAGSGKTLLLVYRARLLSRGFPQKRYLLTCFTRTLAGQLRQQLRDFPNVDIQHLDGLIHDLIRKASLEHPGYDDQTGENAAECALAAIDLGLGPRYHGVFVDEGQDFNVKALELVRRLLLPDCHDLVIAADMSQNIFQRQFSWRDAGIEAQGRTRILKVNYRNSAPIARFAAALRLEGSNGDGSINSELILSGTDPIPIPIPNPSPGPGLRSSQGRFSDVETAPPSIITTTSLQEEITTVIECVKRLLTDSNRPRQIAVLYGTGTEDLADRAQLLHESLTDAGISVYWVNHPDDKTRRDRLALATEPVILSTIHSAKGLEFDNVVLCGLPNETAPRDSSLSLAYVGITRATRSLSVVSRKGHWLNKEFCRAAEAAR